MLSSSSSITLKSPGDISSVAIGGTTRAAATRLFSTRERVHITRFDGDRTDEEGGGQGGGESGGTDSQSTTPPKAVTCLWYDLGPSRGVGRDQKGGDGEQEADAFSFYYLGGSTSNFLRYIQQELSTPEAKEEGINQEKIEDLVTQKVGSYIES